MPFRVSWLNLLTSRDIVGRSLDVLSVTNFQILAESALKSASLALKNGAFKLRLCHFVNEGPGILK